ncbi:MAG: hypothetical protein R2716_03295 [Microthrixaceae bacterium]
MGALVVSTDGRTIEGIVSERDPVRRPPRRATVARRTGVLGHDRRGAHLLTERYL